MTPSQFFMALLVVAIWAALFGLAWIEFHAKDRDQDRGAW